jgi:2-methylcitrate dehydratase PrpD
LVSSRQQSGPCTIWGTNIQTTSSNASFINGCAIRHLDANDLYVPPMTIGMLTANHASDSIGAIIAAAQQYKQKINGQKLLTSIILVINKQINKYTNI